MRAIVQRRFGPPDVLEPAVLDAPKPGPGEVLIDVAFVNVTFVETQVRAGRPPNPRMAPTLPAIPGNGVGGTIGAVGDGVDLALLGRTVVASTGGSGAYAERVVVGAEAVIPVPDGVALDDAVALMADGRTALSLMHTAHPQPGEAVLVEAAGGGVGSLLVQLSAAAGAHVIAAASAERKLAVATALGADVTVNYARAGWTELAGPVDVVFDGVGGEIGRAAFGLLREGGRYCPFGAASGSFAGVQEADAAARDVRIARAGPPAPEQLRALAAEALAAAAAGRLRPVIGQRFALEHAAQAHRAIESRATIGKTLLTI
jgi:NADPH2:quinone reductase